MDEPLGWYIDNFPSRSMQCGRALREMLESDPADFFQQALPYLRTRAESPGLQYLITLLLMNDLLLAPLSDPTIFSFEESLGLVRMLMKTEPMLDIKMVRKLVESREDPSAQQLQRKVGSAAGIRTLELMAAVSDGARILPVMAQLLTHPDSRVRSKAALLVGRSNKNHRWVEQRLAETDPRVRANAIESLWGEDSDGCRTVLWAALSDTDNRVVGNALLGLYRAGEAGCIAPLLAKARDSDVGLRVTAIWVMGETGDQRFAPILARSLNDPNPKIRTAVFRALAKIRQAAAKTQGSSLTLHLGTMERMPSSWVQTNFAAWISDPGANPQECRGLKATQVSLQYNGELVNDYELSETFHPESLSLAFAVPRIAENDDPFHAACVEAFNRSVQHKRKHDGWMVLKYVPEEPHKSGESFSGMLGLSRKLDPNVAPVESIPLPDEARFQQDPEAIAAAVAAPGVRMSLPSGLQQAMRSMAPILSQSRGTRHAVLIQHPKIDDATSPTWLDIVRSARAAKTVVHAVGCFDSPALRDVCARTRGTYLLVKSAQVIPAALEALCASLVHYYQLRFRIPNSDSTAVAAVLKLQVQSPGGMGEVTVNCEFARPSVMAAAEVA